MCIAESSGRDGDRRGPVFIFKGMTIWLEFGDEDVKATMEEMASGLKLNSIPSPHMTLHYGMEVDEAVGRRSFAAFVAKLRKHLGDRGFPALTATKPLFGITYDGVDGEEMVNSPRPPDSHTYTLNAHHKIFVLQMERFPYFQCFVFRISPGLK